MRTTREILRAILASPPPKITIDAVQADGDVAFHLLLKDCALLKEDFANPITKTHFFSNFVGELLVRENIQKFAVILTGLDQSLYQKLICTSSHSAFGMGIDHKWTTMTFQLHLSLVQEILTEDFARQIEYPSGFDEFDQSQPNNHSESTEPGDNE